MSLSGLQSYVRHALLLICLGLAVVIVWSSPSQPGGTMLLAQDSPLSPLPTMAAESPLTESNAPLRPETQGVARESSSASTVAYPATPTDLPLGEPLRAPTSLVLVGLVLAGLVGVVISIGIRWRS